MKRLVSLILSLFLASGAAVAFAEAPFTPPYEGDEIVWHGVSPDYGQEAMTTCRAQFDEWVGHMRVEWEYLPGDGFDEKAKIFMASAELPDIIPLTDPKNILGTYGTDCSEIFLNFNDYLDYMPNLRQLIERYPVYNDVLAPGGERYFLFGVFPSDGAGESWFANRSLLDEVGVAVPETFDDLITAMRAVKAAKPDSVPYQSYWNLEYATHWIARAMGAENPQTFTSGKTSLFYWDSESETYKFLYREPAAKRRELIETMAMLFKEGLINPEIATMSFEQELNAMATGNWAFATCYMDSLANEACKVNLGEELPFDVEPMLPPATPDGNRYINLTYVSDNSPWWVMACSKNVKNPEMMAAYLDEVLSDRDAELYNYGIEGTHYDVVDGVRVQREGINPADEGISYVTNTHYMIGIYPKVMTGKSLLGQRAFTLAQYALKEAVMTGLYDRASIQFGQEQGEQRASMENVLKTFVEENEAKFIYGFRSFDEWDTYVAEIEKLVDVDTLLGLYNTAGVVVKQNGRIYLTE